MRKALWINAALLAVVVALGWLAHVTPRHDRPMEYPLSAQKSGAVKNIRIERKARRPIVLERKGDRWYVTSPIAARAEAFNVWRLLAILDAKASTRLPAIDLSRFDLDQPNFRVTVEGQTFSFGMVNTMAREQYVMTSGRVYTVPARYGAALPSDVTQLIERHLFASDEAPVAFEFEGFSVRMSGGKWIVVTRPRESRRAKGSPSGRCDVEARASGAPPDCGVRSSPHDLSQDEINRWVDNWRHASALRAVPFVGGKPASEITVALKHERKLRLGILQRKPELALLRRDENLLYYFAAGATERLLRPPGTYH